MSVQMRVHCLRTGVLILGPKRTRRSRGNPAPNLNKIRQVKDKPNSTIQMSAADIFICLDWTCVCVRVCVCVCVLFAHGLGIRIRDVKLWPFDSRKCSCWPRKKDSSTCRHGRRQIPAARPRVLSRTVPSSRRSSGNGLMPFSSFPNIFH